jgi:fido (protein-threonine AMPylation protein)
MLGHGSQFHEATVQQARGIAAVLLEHGAPMSRAELAVRAAPGVPLNTFLRWLDAAQQLGLISRGGASRATVYQPSDEYKAQAVAARLAEPANRREKVTYKRDFLYAYEPNKSSLLGAARVARLNAKCAPGSSPVKLVDERRLMSFMADLAYSSSRLEGNTYSYNSMLKLVEEGVEASGHDPHEAVMLMNHYSAAKFLVQNIAYPPREGDPAVSAFDVRALHAMLSHDLLPDPRRCGQLRMTAVEIGGSAYIPPARPDEIRECFEHAIATAARIRDPFEQSFFLMVHLPYLQPFDDCNKRTARVSCSIPLLRAGVLPMSWYDTVEKDYVNAVIAVYECNDTYSLAEIFTHGYMRSFERFEAVHRSIRPDHVAAQYRNQARKAVAQVLEDGPLAVPESVRPEDRVEFLRYVQEQLHAIRDNPTLASAYGCDPRKVAQKPPSESDSDTIPRLS